MTKRSRRAGWKRCPLLEQKGASLLKKWQRMEEHPVKDWEIVVFLSNRRRRRSGICYQGRRMWPSMGIRTWVDGIIVLPNHGSISIDDPLFKHELLHVLLPKNGHDALFQSWKRTVGAL